MVTMSECSEGQLWQFKIWVWDLVWQAGVLQVKQEHSEEVNEFCHSINCDLRWTLLGWAEGVPSWFVKWQLNWNLEKAPLTTGAIRAPNIAEANIVPMVASPMPPSCGKWLKSLSKRNHQLASHPKDANKTEILPVCLTLLPVLIVHVVWPVQTRRTWSSRKLIWGMPPDSSPFSNAVWLMSRYSFSHSGLSWLKTSWALC